MGGFRFQPPLVCHGHTRPIVDLQYSPETPDGVFLISASKDGSPMLRRGETGDWVGTFQGHKGAVWAAALDDSALLAATGSADFSARVWNAVTGDQLHEFSHRHIVRAVAFSHGGSGGAGAAGAPARPASPSEGASTSASASAGEGAEPDASAVPSAAPGSAPLLATGGPERLIRIFDLGRPDAEPTVFEKARDSVRKLAWTRDDRVLLASYLDEPGLDLLDPRTGRVERTIETRGAVKDVSFTPDGSRAVLADGHTLTLLDGLEKVRDFTPSGCTAVESGAVAPARGLLAAGGADMWVHLYDLETGELLDSGKGHHGPVHVVRFAPDLASLASGSEDGTIRIWSTQSSKEAAREAEGEPAAAA